jgi:hypothetical protein
VSRTDSQVLLSNTGAVRPSSASDDGAARQHLAALRTTLSWADRSAARGDYADALVWIDVVEATGHELPDEYRAKRETWLGVVALERLDGGLA